MVIKTAVKPGRPKLPSKRPTSLAYEIGKNTLKYFGYYEDIKQYDPGYYFERYKYKTGKRIRSKIAQTIQKKFQVPQRNATNYYKYKKPSTLCWRLGRFCPEYNISKGSY